MLQDPQSHLSRPPIVTQNSFDTLSPPEEKSRSRSRRFTGPFVDGNFTFPRRKGHASSFGSRSSASRGSQEIHLNHDVTRDSMVENMLRSFNEGPEERPASLDGDEQFKFFRQHIMAPAARAMEKTRDFRDTSIESDDDDHRYGNDQNGAASEKRQRAGTGRSLRSLRSDREPPDTSFPSPSTTARNDSTSTSTTPVARSKQKSKGSISTVGSIDPVIRGGGHASQGRHGSSRQGSVDYSPSSGNTSSKARMAASANSVLNRSRPVPPEYHNFDAAKAPTIRNVTNSPSPSPRPTYVSPNAPSNLHPKPRTSHGPGSSGYASSDATGRYFHEASPLPTDRPHAPRHAASMGNLDPSRRQPSDSLPPPLPPPPKEKAGFFKRVFGGGNKATAAHQELRQGPPQLPAISTAIRNDPRPIGSVDSAFDMAPPSASVSSPFSTEPPPIPDDEETRPLPPQSLRNKTSFFRRRRKTGPSDKDAHSTNVSTPTASNNNLMNGTGEKTSATTLRKAMNPFLNEAATLSHENLATEEAKFTSIGGGTGENLFTFARNDRRDSAQNRSQRSGSASRAEASSPVPFSRPNDSLRPSTSIRRENESSSPSNSDIRASLIGSYDSQIGRHAMKVVRNAPPSSDMTNLHNMLLGISPVVASNREDAQTNRSRSRSPMTASPAPESKPSIPAAASPFSKSKASAMQRTASDTRSTSSSRPDKEESSSQTIPAENSRSPDSHQPDSPIVESEYQSATSLPLVQVEAEENPQDPPQPPESTDPENPTPADFELAKQMIERQADPATHAKRMAVLHQADAAGERARRAYLGLYDFAGLSILQALRDLCSRIALKGETQQVDRILSTFARRWCQCNSNHGFKSVDVVHTICYSILLLNTDLHLADVDSKMSRSQFIKNTLPTVRGVAEDVQGDDTLKVSSPVSPTSRPPMPWRDARSPTPVETLSSSSRPSVEQARSPNGRLSVLSPTLGRPLSETPSFASPSPYSNRSADGSSALVNAPFDGSQKLWEQQVETVLRDIYASIREERLPLHGASERHLQAKDSSSALSVGSAMRRTGSVLSKTPSEGTRGRLGDSHSMGPGSRFASRNRTKGRLYPASTFSSSRTASRTSLEEGMWSPSASSTWSKSLYQTQTTMSTDSIGSRMTSVDDRYQQSIGFANALSNAIIREEGQGDEDEDVNLSFEIDELLELAGAPFAKEGLVKHKHHLETTDKKAKDRNWNEVFVVIEKGWLRMFSFNTKSVRAAQKKSGGRTVVGGGNWTENAETTGAFMLRQTIANALPPPGYSKQRPYVFALSLPTGAVHLFHVGTMDIAKEFVSTANYWSARLSKEPLVGGVSNIEYGWGDHVINTALLPDELPSRVTSPTEMRTVTPTSSGRTGVASPTSSHAHSRGGSVSMSVSHSSRPSFSGSIRGSVEAASTRAKTPADRLQLADWTPPQQSLMASTLPEVQQLTSLQAYVQSIEEELAHHNELRAPMQLAFSPRHPNAAKAMSNWEKKSSHLLREIVKFRTYIDCLLNAKAQREKIMAEREEYEAQKKERGKSHEKQVSQSTNGSFEFPEETKEAIRMAQAREHLPE